MDVINRLGKCNALLMKVKIQGENDVWLMANHGINCYLVLMPLLYSITTILGKYFQPPLYNGRMPGQ